MISRPLVTFNQSSHSALFEGTLDLEDNDFTGEVPEGFYSLSGLKLLRLSNNTGLTGTLSENISQLTDLQQLSLENTGLGGTLPEGLFDLVKLSSLELNIGNFSGTLSESFQKLEALQYLRLQNNTFTGTLPAAFTQLPLLRKYMASESVSTALSLCVVS
jgi:hypothetical protein